MSIKKNQLLDLIQLNLPTSGSPLIRSQKHREVENSIVDYATNIIALTSIAGSTIIDSRIINREVGAIIIDDYCKNTGFNKIETSNTITFTDGTSLIDGQKITIFLL